MSIKGNHLIKYIAVAFVTIFLLLVVYKIYQNKRDCGFSAPIQIQTNETNFDKIGQIIATKWLDKYKCKGTIRSYSIDYVHFGDKNNNQLGYSLSYSVTPAYLSTYRIFGCVADWDCPGSTASFMSLTKEGNTYTFQNVSSGP